jgi:spore coat protein U-like protein
VAFVVFPVPLSPGTALATGSTTAAISVTARILGSCTATTIPVNFGTYDTNQAGDTQAQGAVTLVCATGTIPTVAMNLGQHFASVGNTQQGATNPAATSSGVTITRAMGNQGTYLGYDLFTDSSYKTIWNSSNTISPGQIGSGEPVTLTIYGDIPQKQTQALTAGAFSDSIVVTISW